MMGGLILIIIMIVLAAKGDYTLLWILGGILVLGIICSAFGKGRSSLSGSRKWSGARLDPSHYSGAKRYGYSSSGTRASYASYDDEDEEPVRRKGIRIEHPHAIDDTDYECSVCGRRFDREVGNCPFCGAVFSGKKTDYEEFDFEEDELEDWDEEEGW